MRAIQVSEYGGSDVLETTEANIPEFGSDEVRIRVHTVGVNFADISRRRGDSRSSQSPPFIPGLEVSGTVDAAGEKVNYEEGDRVVAFMSSGGYAEYAVVHGNSVFELPDEISFDEAAAVLIQFLTAYHTLHDRAGVTRGEDVLVHAAAGGVGSAAVQLAIIAGATVYGTASMPEKIDWVDELGAAHVINYTETSFVDEITELTDDEGVDVVLDGVGGQTLENSVYAVAPFGRIVSIGAASGREGEPDPSLLRLKNVSLLGYHLSATMDEQPKFVASTLTDIFDLLIDGDIDPNIQGVYSLENAQEVHDLIEKRKHYGKALLRV